MNAHEHENSHSADKKIKRVISKLTSTARELADPRAATLSPNATRAYSTAVFRSPDALNFVVMHDHDIKYKYPNIPHEQIKEGMIPLILHRFSKPNESIGHARVWLDREGPQVLQPACNGLPINVFEELSHEERKKVKFIKRSDLLPSLLDALSGKKIKFK